MTMFHFTAKIGKRETSGQFYSYTQEAAITYIANTWQDQYGKRFHLLTVRPLTAQEESQVKAGQFNG